MLTQRKFFSGVIPVPRGYLGLFTELLKLLFFLDGEDKGGVGRDSPPAIFTDDVFFVDFFSSPPFPLSGSANPAWVCKVKPKSLSFHF